MQEFRFKQVTRFERVITVYADNLLQATARATVGNNDCIARKEGVEISPAVEYRETALINDCEDPSEESV